MFRIFIKPLLFLMNAETAHHFTTRLFGILLRIPLLSQLMCSYFQYEDSKLETKVLGLTFPNPVGLAAGFDKEGKYFSSMSRLGFGFIEIGTVTPVGQAGNPKPRLFRLPDDAALINRMGFNNEGVDSMVSRLKDRKDRSLIIGGNIGKNKLTPNEDAISDYETCFEKLYPYVDYFVVNVSSPNTPGLRSLQEKEPLTRLLKHLIRLRQEKSKRIPILLKIAPDLNQSQLDDVLSILAEIQLDGIIATNTTISRADLKTSESTLSEIGNGGLSGAPLRARSLEVVSYIRSVNPDLVIIGVGGISHPDHAVDMLKAGADLVQVYSGMIYSGPGLIKAIKKKLAG